MNASVFRDDMKYAMPTGSGGYGRVASPSKRVGAGEWCLEKMLSVFIIAIFIVWVMPFLIAPSLGVTPEVYQQYLILWSFIAGIVSLPFAWAGTKLLTYLIRFGG